MKKSVFVLILISITSIAFAQKKKKSESTAAQQEAAAPAQPQQTQPVSPKDSIQINPLVRHYFIKYQLAVQWGDYEEAKDALYDLIIENQATDSIVYELSYYYLQNQKFAPAVLVAQELLKRNPKNVAALEICGIGFENLGVFERALQNYESLYLLQNDPNTLYKMAFLQYRLKRYKESSTSIDILMTDKTVDTLQVNYSTSTGQTKAYAMKVALFNLKGMLALDQGDKVNAKKFFEQALAIAPDFTIAKENLAKTK